MYIVNVEAAIARGDQFLMIIRGEQESHAAGTLSFPGGKVEQEGDMEAILEATLRREIAEEVGVEVDAEMEYVQSTLFVASGGEPVIDIVFLCRYAGGAPAIADPGEVAGIQWLTASRIFADPKTPPWIRRSVELVEQRRLAKR